MKHSSGFGCATPARDRAYPHRDIITDENLINFKRNERELQEYLLYCGFSVMRSRDRAVEALLGVLDGAKGTLPFERIKWLRNRRALRRQLESTRIGCYDRLERFLEAVSMCPFDLRSCSLDELRSLPGLGQAKACFFLLNTREDARVAVLDRHILAELRSMGYDVPDAPPQSEKAYRRIEDYFLAEADEAGVLPARFNLSSWRKRAKPSERSSNKMNRQRP